MSNLLAQVLFYGIAAAAAAPIVVVLGALILGKSKRPIASLLMLTGGAAFLDVICAIAIFAIISASGGVEEGGDIGAIIDIALGVIFLVIGASAVFSHESPEKEAAKRERAEKAAAAGLRAMFVTGIAVQIINIDAMAVMSSGLKEIAEANVTSAEAIIAFVVLLAVMLIGYYGPAVVYLLSPARSARVLGRLTEWILQNSRYVEIVVGLGFGAVFLVKGLQSYF
jgi:threonine/homoserine/homoserine lactone efflux protein